MPDAGDFVLLLVAGRVCCLLPFFIVASSHAALFEEFSTWSISLGDLWSTMWHRHQDDLKKGSVCHHTLWGKSRQREMTAENTTIFQRLLSVIAATAMTWTRNTKIMEMWCLLSYFSSTNIFLDKIFFLLRTASNSHVLSTRFLQGKMPDKKEISSWFCS